jgi:hypothetical protein
VRVVTAAKVRKAGERGGFFSKKLLFSLFWKKNGEEARRKQGRGKEEARRSCNTVAA